MVQGRVKGSEAKPQEGYDKYQHKDKKNGFSKKMAGDQTYESRVQGKNGRVTAVFQKALFLVIFLKFPKSRPNFELAT